MRKLLVLPGLVLGIGWGGTALAQSGSDSSGTHSYSLECVGEDLVGSNTGQGTIWIYFPLAMGSGGATLGAGESENFGTPGIDTAPPGAYFEVWFEDPDGSGDFHGLDSGNFPDCADGTTTTTETPDEAPALISECRGADWYLVHPDNTASVTYAYRMSTGDILYDADYTSNNPAAVYGEVLIPADVDEVGYVDDFNNVHDVTRPAACGGPATPAGPTTTTVPPTTVTTQLPSAPAALDPITGDGFVAPGSEIGPGMATFGASGFGAGEVVDVTLFSTPRSLGTVTAADDGTVSITFEVLASDGAGEHRVEFSGPSGTVSVPFTLVLPAQSLPVTR